MREPFPEMRVIFAEEFRQQVFNPGFIFVTAVILVPTVVIVVMIVAGVGDFRVSFSEEGLDDDEVSELLERTGYVDQAGALSGPGLQDAPKRYNDSAEGIQAVRQGEIDTLFVLTADYLESGAVEQYRTSPEGGGRFSGNPDAESAFNDFLRVELIVGQVEADTLTRVSNPGHYESFDVAADGTIATAIRILEKTVGLTMLAVLFPIAAMFGRRRNGEELHRRQPDPHGRDAGDLGAGVFCDGGKAGGAGRHRVGLHSGVDRGGSLRRSSDRRLDNGWRPGLHYVAGIACYGVGSLCPGVFPLLHPGAVSWCSRAFAGAGPTTNEHIGLVRRAASGEPDCFSTGSVHSHTSLHPVDGPGYDFSEACRGRRRVGRCNRRNAGVSRSNGVAGAMDRGPHIPGANSAVRPTNDSRQRLDGIPSPWTL